MDSTKIDDDEAIPITEWPPVDEKKPANLKYNETAFVKRHNETERDMQDASKQSKKQKLHSLSTAFSCDTNSNLYKLAELAAKNCWSADLAIAKWWKNNQDLHVIDNQHIKAMQASQTMLNWLKSLPDCTKLLRICIAQLEADYAKNKDSAKLLICLSSYHETLKEDGKAIEALNRAAKLIALSDETQWSMERMKRNVEIKLSQENLLNAFHNYDDVTNVQPDKVDVCFGSELSSKYFYENYVLKGKPLVFKNLSNELVDKLWDFTYLLDIIGRKSVKLKTHSILSTNWAKLVENSTSTNVGEFLNNILMGKEGLDSYLFDWSLPLYAPELLNGLRIPKYFYNDFLQRTSDDSLYKNSWPSLFIAPRGLFSDLHVDAFASNFWMALFHGKKKWTFFSREDFIKLYPRYNDGLDANFEINLKDPDYMRFPLLQHARRKECILEAGDVLFVPYGSPHHVENMENSLAISSNFVDNSNFDNVLCELNVSSLVNPCAKNLATELKSQNFDRKMVFPTKHVSWQTYQTQNHSND